MCTRLLKIYSSAIADTIAAAMAWRINEKIHIILTDILKELSKYRMLLISIHKLVGKMGNIDILNPFKDKRINILLKAIKAYDRTNINTLLITQ